MARRRDRINNTIIPNEYWATACNDCMNACFAQGSHCGGCTSYNQGPPCTCILQSISEPPGYQYCCGYDGSHCSNQCSSACAGWGSGYTGRMYHGGQGSGRSQKGGPIRRKMHAGGHSFNMMYGTHPYHHSGHSARRARKDRRHRQRKQSAGQGSTRRMGGHICPKGYHMGPTGVCTR